MSWTWGSAPGRVVRAADFAGAWYPDSHRSVLAMLDAFDGECPRVENAPEAAAVRALIVPHAGWTYSGRTAWSAFRRALSDRVALAVVFGGHLAPGSRPILHDCAEWETPVRTLARDDAAFEALRPLAGFAIETERRYRRDNGIELVLPMVAAAWPNARIVALGIPPTDEGAALGEAIGRTLTDRTDAIFIGSTDLTHYGPSYGFTPRDIGERAHEWVFEENDAEFVRCAEAVDAHALIESARVRQNACCAGAAAAAVAAAGAQRGYVTDRTTSHEKSGGRPVDFVGYAGLILA